MNLIWGPKMEEAHVKCRLCGAIILDDPTSKRAHLEAEHGARELVEENFERVTDIGESLTCFECGAEFFSSAEEDLIYPLCPTCKAEVPRVRKEKRRTGRATIYRKSYRRGGKL
jgi:Zn finger protein HypA/HybF involved in hydrogenase expression